MSTVRKNDGEEVHGVPAGEAASLVFVCLAVEYLRGAVPPVATAARTWPAWSDCQG